MNVEADNLIPKKLELSKVWWNIGIASLYQANFIFAKLYDSFSHPGYLNFISRNFNSSKTTWNT